MTTTILKSTFSLLLLIGLLAASPLSCEGPEGPEGEPGPAGQTGPEGPAGVDGEDGKDGKNGADATSPSYVLDTACEHCHEEIHAQWRRSGHANAMIKVWDAPPDNPPYTTYPEPPTDDQGTTYTWNDVTTIIGGFAWGAMFTDAKGYLITGSEVRYDFGQGAYGPYAPEVAAGTEVTTCGKCHTTGYVGLESHEAFDKEDDLEGMGGAWFAEGITCENAYCHGKGGVHNQALGFAPIQLDRSSRLCAKCHSLAPQDTVAAAAGLITSGQQANEVGRTMMQILECVDCHDPHKSAAVADETLNPEKGIATSCETCHYDKVGQDKVASHQIPGGPTCVTCHMPRAVRSPAAEPTSTTGAIRSHLFRINADPTAPQFSVDGTQAMPYLGLTFACRQCHVDPQDRTDAELTAAAAGYHD